MNESSVTYSLVSRSTGNETAVKLEQILAVKIDELCGFDKIIITAPSYNTKWDVPAYNNMNIGKRYVKLPEFALRLFIILHRNMIERCLAAVANTCVDFYGEMSNFRGIPFDQYGSMLLTKSALLSNVPCIYIRTPEKMSLVPLRIHLNKEFLNIYFSNSLSEIEISNLCKIGSQFILQTQLNDSLANIKLCMSDPSIPRNILSEILNEDYRIRMLSARQSLEYTRRGGSETDIMDKKRKLECTHYEPRDNDDCEDNTVEELWYSDAFSTYCK